MLGLFFCCWHNSVQPLDFVDLLSLVTTALSSALAICFSPATWVSSSSSSLVILCPYRPPPGHKNFIKRFFSKNQHVSLNSFVKLAFVSEILVIHEGTNVDKRRQTSSRLRSLYPLSQSFVFYGWLQSQNMFCYVHNTSYYDLCSFLLCSRVHG